MSSSDIRTSWKKLEGSIGNQPPVPREQLSTLAKNKPNHKSMGHLASRRPLTAKRPIAKKSKAMILRTNLQNKLSITKRQQKSPLQPRGRKMSPLHSPRALSGSRSISPSQITLSPSPPISPSIQIGIPPKAPMSQMSSSRKIRPQSAYPDRQTQSARLLIRPMSTTRFGGTSSQWQVEGLTHNHVRKIYIGKCKDLGIAIFPGQQERFFEFCSKHLVDRRFDLRDSGLGTEAAKAIGEALAHTDAFAFVNLSRNPIGDVGARAVANSLAKNKALVALDMSSNDLSSDGASYILKMVTQHQSLISLDISSPEGLNRNRLLDNSTKYLSRLLRINPYLLILNIGGTAMGKKGCRNMLKGLENNETLQSLNIRQNDLGGEMCEEIFNIMATTNVREFDISENKIGDVGCEHFHKMIKGDMGGSCPFTKLDMSKNGITHQGTEQIWTALGLNGSIRHLNLDRNEFGAIGIAGFSKMAEQNQGLSVISMNACEIKVEGCSGISEGVSQNKNLRKLCMTNNWIGDVGARILSHALVKNNFLESLDLRSNRIGEVGGLALCNALKQNFSLNTINLIDNNLQDNVGRMFGELTRARATLKTVLLKANPINHRYISYIKENIERNKTKGKAQQGPKIKNEIAQLSVRENSLEDIHKQIERAKSVQGDLHEKVQQHKTELDGVKSHEEETTKKYEDETQQWKKNTTAAAADLQKERDNLQITQIHLSRAAKDLDDQINILASEIKRLQTSKTNLRQDYALRRTQEEQKLKTAQSDYEDQKRNKRFSLMTLQGFEKQVDALKKNFDGNKTPNTASEHSEKVELPPVRRRGKKGKKGKAVNRK